MKAGVLRVLRVPPEPTLPLGSMDAWVFRAAPGYYRYRLTLWGLKQGLAILGLVASLVALSALLDSVSYPLAVAGLRGAEAFAWIAFLVQLPISLAVLNLDFELRWYIVSDRSLRIREGILALREKTMTFANVQNIEVRQNPLQRLLGVADVRVRTAGGGSGGQDGRGRPGESMHEAYFRGVDNAEQIRSAIAERVRLLKDSGLGDHEDARRESTRSRRASPLLRAATELHMEARALRAALEQVGP